MRAVIVHAPLVGPSTVIPLADRLAALGVATDVPDLRDALGSPEQFLQRAIAAAAGADVVIGHSGAGAFVPAVADGADARVAVFVDAVVPAALDACRPSVQLLELLDTVPTVDGLLAPWNEWWPAQVMAELVPDAVQRQRVVAEMPRLPRSFYATAVPLPAGWWTRPSGYLRLSPAYDDDLARASGWGWPTATRSGRHLDTCTEPVAVADHVRALVDRLR